MNEYVLNKQTNNKQINKYGTDIFKKLWQANKLH